MRLPIPEQIEVLEAAKKRYQNFVKEQKERAMFFVNGTAGDHAYICGPAAYELEKHLNKDSEEIYVHISVYCIEDYIPCFSRGYAVTLARKYKFKKPNRYSYWWSLVEKDFSTLEKKTYDYRNRIAFFNAAIKELKTHL